MFTKRLFDQLTPVALYGKIASLFPDDIAMLFESVVNTSEGNFSFITLGVMERIVYRDGVCTYTKAGIEEPVSERSPFAFLKRYYASIDRASYKRRAEETGFSFTDGFIGYIGYDMVKVFEPVLASVMDPLEDTLHTPDLDLVRPQIIIGYSHKNAELTLICNDASREADYRRILAMLDESHRPIPLKKATLKNGTFGMSKARFMQIVEEAKENIRAGDIFQIVLSNRYTQEGEIDPLSFYRLLRSKNPSPYLFLLRYEDFSICGSSPEVMVRLTDGEILLRPIAGTRKRGKNAKRDKELEEEMLNDPKERAEHLMLIDLGRNDVGRVAKTGTVKVPEMMRVERYSHVMHMVSDVVAEIEDDKDMFDLFAATFTAGTMTGAPKIKAMELIAAYEGLKRGFYSGSVGYFAFDGNMDSAIAIRTALINEKGIALQAGAGVVADSVPELEYLEVTNKLGALHATLEALSKIEEEV